MQITEMILSRFRFAGDLARAADVARVLVKYGLAGFLADVDWEPGGTALKSEGGAVLSDHTFEARVRMALTDLGTTYIKLGQMLSTRPDLVGKELATELTKLQASTPADPPEVAIAVVEAELGRPIGEIFREFDGVALASASVGQVHRARLKNGRRAVVKVQHPGIEGIVQQDLDILGFLAELAEKNEQIRRYQPMALVREFSRTTLNELDFRRELRNLQTFRRNFAKDETITFPRPYSDLTSARVLTMEFIKGCSVDDARQLEKLEVNRTELAKRGANVFVEMMFRDGFYHADPHPGNFLILRSGKIGLLDAGMVGRVDDALRKQIEDILMAAGDLDAARLTDAVTRLCGSPRTLDRGALGADLTELFQEYGTTDMSHFNVGGALSRVTDILHEHKLILPGRVSMLIKCLMLLEGTGRLLSPTFSLAEVLAPWRKTFLLRRFSPEARMRSARQLFTDWERIAEAAPKIISELLDRMETGDFTFRLQLRYLKAAANRLVVGLFVSSLLITSSILIVREIPPRLSPRFWGLSVPGLLGYVAALFYGARMIWTNRDNRVSGGDGNWDE